MNEKFLEQINERIDYLKSMSKEIEKSYIKGLVQEQFDSNKEIKIVKKSALLAIIAVGVFIVGGTFLTGIQVKSVWDSGIAAKTEIRTQIKEIAVSTEEEAEKAKIRISQAVKDFEENQLTTITEEAKKAADESKERILGKEQELNKLFLKGQEASNKMDIATSSALAKAGADSFLELATVRSQIESLQASGSKVRIKDLYLYIDIGVFIIFGALTIALLLSIFVIYKFWRRIPKNS